MTTKINLYPIEVILSAKLDGEGVTFPFDDTRTLHNRFKVTVRIGNKRAVFNFYDSQKNYQDDVRELDSKALINAFDCILSHATCSSAGFEEFCSELGYDTDSRKAERTYKECVKSCKKMERIYLGSLPDLYNEFQEKINNIA